jgi:hypothetical protein
MTLNRISASDFTQRPIDAHQAPQRIPITEWEWQAKHVGEPPRTLSSSDSGLHEFSIHSSSDDLGGFIDDLAVCQKTQKSDLGSDDEPHVKMDPHDAGKALQGELQYISETHAISEDRINRSKAAAEASISTFRFPYFDDVHSSDTKMESSHLPQLSMSGPTESTETQQPISVASTIALKPPKSKPIINLNLDPSFDTGDLSFSVVNAQPAAAESTVATDEQVATMDRSEFAISADSFSQDIVQPEVTAEFRDLGSAGFDSPPSKPEPLRSELTSTLMSRTDKRRSVSHLPSSTQNVPEKVKYDCQPLKNEEPAMMKRDPLPNPQRPPEKKVERIEYTVEPIPDHSPMFWRKPKKQKSPRVQFEPTPDPEKKPKKEKEEVRRKVPTDESSKRLFFDPAETKSSKFRNQTIRERMAIAQERVRIEQEEEMEREAHRRAVGARVEPELKRLAEISHARQKKADRSIGKSIGELKKVLDKVDEMEVMLRRNDRSLILVDVGNKQRKEKKKKAAQTATDRLNKRRQAHERVQRMMTHPF